MNANRHSSSIENRRCAIESLTTDAVSGVMANAGSVLSIPPDGLTNSGREGSGLAGRYVTTDIPLIAA